VLLGVSLASLVLLTTLGGTSYDWDSAFIIGLGVLSVLALVGFVAVERAAEEPILPRGLVTAADDGSLRLTDTGGAIRKQLLAARRRRLDALVADWEPESAEVDAMIAELSEELRRREAPPAGVR
jgi:hypothetical protein